MSVQEEFYVEQCAKLEKLGLSIEEANSIIRRSKVSFAVQGVEWAIEQIRRQAFTVAEIEDRDAPIKNDYVRAENIFILVLRSFYASGSRIKYLLERRETEEALDALLIEPPFAEKNYIFFSMLAAGQAYAWCLRQRRLAEEAANEKAAA